MRRTALTLVSLATLAACSPPVPDSGAGVGFETYAQYQARREAALISNGQGGLIAAGPQRFNSQEVSTEAVASPAPARRVAAAAPVATAANASSDLADDALAAIGQTNVGAPADPTGQLAGQAELARPYAVENSAGISEENDFDSVSSERSIAQDAVRQQAIRDSYQVIEPTAVPSRPSGSGTSLVEFALSTRNSVGQPIYSRLIVGAESRAARNCAKYPSSDLAQEAFLAGGGPERNPQGLDPDGDGFACSWDPSPFRNAVR